MSRFRAKTSRYIDTSLARLAVHEFSAPADAGTSAPVVVLWPSILAGHWMYEAFIEAWSPAATIPQGRCMTLPTAHISVVDAPRQVAVMVDRFLREDTVLAIPGTVLTGG